MEPDCIIVGNTLAVIDSDQHALVSGYTWHCRRLKTKDGVRRYAATNDPKRRGGIIFMHRLIMGNPASDIDHRNGNGLDNRKENLRLATPSQNVANRRKWSGCSSRFKGVAIHKATGKWQAKICCKWKQVFLGLFTSEEEAAKAYDAAAKLFFGEFAVLNFKADETLEVH